LDPVGDHRRFADREPELRLRRLHLARIRVRGDRAALPHEHPLVHGDQPRRAVARVALREPAAVLRGRVRADHPRRAPGPLRADRSGGDLRRHRPRADAPPRAGADDGGVRGLAPGLPLGAGGPARLLERCYFAFAQTTYTVMSAALTLSLTWTIQPELSFGF